MFVTFTITNDDSEYNSDPNSDVEDPEVYDLKDLCQLIGNKK